MSKKDSIKEEITLLRTFLITSIAIFISLVSYCVHNFNNINFLFWTSLFLLLVFIVIIFKLTTKIIKLIKKLEEIE